MLINTFSAFSCLGIERSSLGANRRKAESDFPDNVDPERDAEVPPPCVYGNLCRSGSRLEALETAAD
jgi:hypothetical protein